MSNAGIVTQRFTSFDGVDLAYHVLGDGFPVVLLHGYFSDAATNWIRFGHAARLAEAGFRVVMPDLRAHGESAKPHDAAAYPADALASDGMMLLQHLGIERYHLGGYSLGGRTTVRMLALGASPERIVISGMGLEGLVDTAPRAAHFRHVLSNLGQHERGSPAWFAESFLRTTGGDAVALLRILDTFVDTDPSAIAAIAQPVLVLAGADDSDNGSHHALAELLPQATLAEVPGNHMSAVTKPELGQAIVRFLAD